MEQHFSRPRRLPWIVALTGASGTCYGRRLIEVLLEQVPGIELEVIVSEAAQRVLREEEQFPAAVGRFNLEQLLGKPVTLRPGQRVELHSNRNIGATIASGSYRTEGMIVVPCSMRTLAAISNGLGENLIQRAADVVMKEKRKLIMVPRETPLSAIQIENMLRLARLDVHIVPAMPAFYTRPSSIAELVDSFVLRLADHMGFEVSLGKRWREEEGEERNVGSA